MTVGTDNIIWLFFWEKYISVADQYPANPFLSVIGTRYAVLNPVTPLMYTYIHIYIYTYIHIHIYIYTYTCIYIVYIHIHGAAADKIW